jgi:hypothetical protein
LPWEIKLIGLPLLHEGVGCGCPHSSCPYYNSLPSSKIFVKPNSAKHIFPWLFLIIFIPDASDTWSIIWTDEVVACLTNSCNISPYSHIYPLPIYDQYNLNLHL